MAVRLVGTGWGRSGINDGMGLVFNVGVGL